MVAVRSGHPSTPQPMASIKFIVLVALCWGALAAAGPAERVKKDVLVGAYPYSYAYPYASYAAAPVAYSASYYSPYPAAYSALPLPSYRALVY